MNRSAQISRFRLFIGTLSLLATVCSVAHAVTPAEVLTDPALEARARAISQDLRCVVCQNQSIDDSNAPLAHDLRMIVRERLVAGDTDKQTLGFIVGRYGNFVLLNPPLQLNTAALWAGPAVFVLAAAIGAGVYLRRRSSERMAVALTPIEEERIAELLSKRTLT